MRILLIYPGHLFSTFDVCAGYDRALQNIDGMELGAFAYHSALSFYKDASDIYRANNPDVDMPEGAYIALASERVAVQAAEFKPDVALVVAGLAFGRRGYELLAAMNIPVAIILTESPYLDEIQANMARKTNARALFTNDRASVGRLAEDTGVRTVYLPHSYDPERHRPQDPNPARASDLFFHGTLWPERKALFAELEGLPYRMHLGGLDPALMSSTSTPGMMDNAMLPSWYSSAAISLNHHRTFIGRGVPNEHIEAGSAYSLGPRAFEIAASGAFQLCDDTRQELSEVFGDSVATYHDAHDLRERVTYYMQHPAERREMAAESRRRVEGCTFETRAKSIVIPTLEEVI